MLRHPIVVIGAALAFVWAVNSLRPPSWTLVWGLPDHMAQTGFRSKEACERGGAELAHQMDATWAGSRGGLGRNVLRACLAMD